MNRAADLWAARSRRERILLLVLAVALAGVVLWLALRSLTGWREAAAERAQGAAADHALVLAGAALAGRSDAAGPPGGLDVLIRESAADHGLAPVAVTPEADGALNVSVEAAASTAVFGWLAGLEAQGVRVVSLTALKNPDGRLQAAVILAPAA